MKPNNKNNNIATHMKILYIAKIVLRFLGIILTLCISMKETVG